MMIFLMPGGAEEVPGGAHFASSDKNVTHVCILFHNNWVYKFQVTPY